MEQEQKARERSFIRELVPNWRPTRGQVLWAIRITIVLALVLGILTLIGLPFGITLWEWLKLLIVPVVIAAGGLWFSKQQRDREMEIAEQRAQDEALQAYLDRIGQLLLDKDRPLRKSEASDEVRTLARASTLTVLSRLDGARKRSLLEFLYEADLITAERAILDLSEANLRDVKLSGAILNRADLSRADLSRANLIRAQLGRADLQNARMNGADLSDAVLGEANLKEAKLKGANLSNSRPVRADLRRANLEGANLSAAELGGTNLLYTNLEGANLSGASLRGASLRGAVLFEADLSRANLSWANLSPLGLSASAASLEGAIMPDGQKYEDWLRSKGREEDGENSGPS